MNIIKKIGLVLVGAVILLSSFAFIELDKKTYKCLVQLKNYEGEGAYVVVTLVNSKGEYEETLSVMGDEEKWYDSFLDWNKFWQQNKKGIDAVTGESIIGGDRKMVKLKIDTSRLDAGYKLRFETAVEDQDYHPKDVEMELNTSEFKKKVKGKGYIRYVRILPSK